MFDVINNAGGFPPLKLKIFTSSKSETIKPQAFEPKTANLVSLKEILEKRKAVIPFLTTNDSGYETQKRPKRKNSSKGKKKTNKKSKKGSKK